MPDAIARTGPSRFPASAQARVAEAARSAMVRYAKAGARIALGSLAAGSDIILAEAALAAGMRIYAVVPAGLEAFLDASVRGFDRAEGDMDEDIVSWERRLYRIIENEAVTLLTLPADESLPDHAFAAVNDHLLQMALHPEDGMKSLLGAPSPELLSEPVKPGQVRALLVLAANSVSPAAPMALGGTSHFARQLHEANIATEIIDPMDLSGQTESSSTPLGSTTPSSPAATAHTLPPTPDLNALLPEFDRLDKDAIVSQQGWRKSLHRMLALFAILMIITGMELMSDGALNGAGKVLRRIAIACTILGLGVEAGLGLRPNRMHRSWVRSRSGAETLRSAAWSRLMGFPPMALDENAERHIVSPGLDALAAQLGALPLKERWQWYSTHRLRDQADYYAHRSHKLHTLERRLLTTRYVLIILAMVWGILRLANELTGDALIDPHFFHEYQVLAVAIALVSLLHVWLESTQAERLIGRYKALARTLTALAVKVETAANEAEALHAAREGEELLFAQNEEWIGVVG